MKANTLGKKTLFLFDLDGVFYKGKENPVKLGGDRVVETLRANGKKVLVVTNNSTDSVGTIRRRLSAMGIKLAEREILTSARLTAQYLRARNGAVRYYLVGEGGLEAEMRSCGHMRTEGLDAGYVVVGLDRSFTYGKLDKAVSLVRSGASLVATHNSKLYMYRDGPAVAAGPIVKAIEYGSGRRATVVGKPSRLMFRLALETAACRSSEAVMVGDQVDTDIAGAEKAGIDSILVATGVDREARGHRVLATVSKVDDIADYL